MLRNTFEQSLHLWQLVDCIFFHLFKGQTMSTSRSLWCCRTWRRREWFVIYVFEQTLQTFRLSVSTVFFGQSVLIIISGWCLRVCFLRMEFDEYVRPHTEQMNDLADCLDLHTGWPTAIKRNLSNHIILHCAYHMIGNININMKLATYGTHHTVKTITVGTHGTYYEGSAKFIIHKWYLQYFCEHI